MDIPTYADMGQGYFETMEIQVIMSFLKVIDNPMQDIPLIAILRSPIYGFTPEDFIDIRITDKKVSFYEAMRMFVGEKIDLSNEEFIYNDEVMYESYINENVEDDLIYEINSNIEGEEESQKSELELKVRRF